MTRRFFAVLAMAVALASLPASAVLAASQRAAPVAVVRIPFPQDDGTLTPYTFELGYPLMTLVYDTLMWRDRDGVAQPWLAESVETDSAGQRVTVRLAEGARWHDGRPVTAADVAFTFRFLTDHPHPRFTPQLTAIARVDVADAATAVFRLRHPAAGFADQPLADVPIIPQHLWELLPAGELSPPGLPVGSGPYRLVEHRPGESYRFEADTGYFRGAPRVSTLEVPIINEAADTFRAFEQRRADMVPVTLSEDLVERMGRLTARLAEGPSYLGTVLLFNVRQPPFDRVEVRRAVSQALDLERMSNIIGESVAAERGYIHPDSPWASAEALHSFDQAAARAALASLGVPAVEVLAPDNDPVKKEAGRQAALAMERAGLNATSRSVSRDELSRALGEDGSAPTFTAAIGVTPPLVSFDPDFLAAVFGSDRERASLNSTGYASAEFDAAAARVSSTLENGARKAAVGDLLRLVANDAPAIPLFFQTGTYVFRPSVYDGWVFVKGTGIFDKRSFVDAASEPSPPGETTAPRSTVVTPAGGDDSGGGMPFALAGLGLILFAAVVAVVALVRR